MSGSIGCGLRGQSVTRRIPCFITALLKFRIKPDSQLRHPQVRQHLRDVDRLQAFDALDLHDHRFGDHEVRTML